MIGGHRRAVASPCVSSEVFAIVESSSGGQRAARGCYRERLISTVKMVKIFFKYRTNSGDKAAEQGR
jgi:hypothetical protein